MAPELVEKKGYDGVATDCWALGVLLYKILINRTPFEGKFLAGNREKIAMRPIWRQIS
jgi:serine/threonine protein kinase